MWVVCSVVIDGFDDKGSIRRVSGLWGVGGVQVVAVVWVWVMAGYHNMGGNVMSGW